jgi:hypothetical protein
VRGIVILLLSLNLEDHPFSVSSNTYLAYLQLPSIYEEIFSIRSYMKRHFLNFTLQQILLQ